MNKIFCKKNFIYEKKDSITDELVDFIIKKFNIDDSEVFYFDPIHIHKSPLDIDMDRIYNYLKTELEKNIVIYVNKINNQFVNKENNYNFKIMNNITSDFFSDFVITKNYFDKEKYVFSSSRKRFIIKNTSKCLSKRIKILNFMWFLNDYDGEIIFWNNYSIKPSIGKLLIFPASWCFPYEELIKINSYVSMISGYIYREQITNNTNTTHII